MTSLGTIMAGIVKTADSWKISGLGVDARGSIKQVCEECALTCSLRGGNGIELMQAFALTRGATARVAHRIQVCNALSKSVIGDIDVDFSDGEGTVWLFDPETSKRSRDLANTRR